jgi:ribonuclease-3
VWWQRIFNIFTRYSQADKELAQAIHQIVGKFPVKISLYKLAFSHASASSRTHHTGFKESNERLEYLGDALLGAIVAEYLFKKYPFENEGFLTEIRSRMVNRETLNDIARKMGIDELIQHDQNRRGYGTHRSMNGDALEALVGALYLERGFAFCQSFVLNRLIHNYYDMNQVVANNKNFKSTLIEWSQREGKELRFELVQEINNRNGYREFVINLVIDNETTIRGTGLSKKKAEQSASEKACQMYGIQ